MKAFVEASDEAWTYASTHPEESVAAESQISGTTPPAAMETLKLAISEEHTPNSTGKPMGWMSPTDWEETLGLLKRYMGLTSTAPASDYYTNQFITGAGATSG